MDQDVDRRVKARRARLHRAESSGDSSHLLTGMIYCACCDARYFPHKRPNGTVVYSCHSRAKKNKKMVKDPNCKAPHIPVENLDTIVVSKVMHLASDLQLVDEIAKKRAAQEGDCFNAGHRHVEEVRRLDAEIARLMDLLQHDQMASVGEIADAIGKAHAERMSLLPRIEEKKPRLFDVDGFKTILLDAAFAWPDADLRGRRSFLLQLIDGIHIDLEDVRIDWSF